MAGRFTGSSSLTRKGHVTHGLAVFAHVDENLSNPHGATCIEIEKNVFFR